MRRLGMMSVVILLVGGSLLYAEGVENVYDLVVPQEYSSLEIGGGLEVFLGAANLIIL